MTEDQPSLYELMGGETGVRTLVDRFYDLIDSAPEAVQLRSIHPKSLKQSREKFFMFLTGWSGGPALYIEKYGHPRLKVRHAPFSIGVVERDQWRWCMNKALDESGYDPRVIEYLKTHFADATEFLRNQPD